MPLGNPVLEQALGIAASLAADPVKRAAATRIASKIGKAFKKRRATAKQGLSAKRQRVGEDPGTSNCKQYQVVNDEFVDATRSFYSVKLTGIPQDDKMFESRAMRERALITISGFRYCIALRNNLDKPLIFHYAIIAPKNPREFEGGKTDNFFRSMGTEDRAHDFNTQLSAQEFDCLPINSDKFVILKHKKLLIGPKPAVLSSAAYQNEVVPNWVNIDGYERLNRQIRYEINNPHEEANPVWLVYWADHFLNAKNQPPEPNAFHLQRKVITYFRETLNLGYKSRYVVTR